MGCGENFGFYYKSKAKRRRGQQRMRWLDSVTDLVGRAFEQTPGGGGGQGNLACCSPWGCKESDTTERLNNSSKMNTVLVNKETQAIRVLLY